VIVSSSTTAPAAERSIVCVPPLITDVLDGRIHDDRFSRVDPSVDIVDRHRELGGCEGIEFEVLGYRLVGLDGDGSSHRNEPDGHHGDLVLSRFEGLELIGPVRSCGRLSDAASFLGGDGRTGDGCDGAPEPERSARGGRGDRVCTDDRPLDDTRFDGRSRFRRERSPLEHRARRLVDEQEIVRGVRDERVREGAAVAGGELSRGRSERDPSTVLAGLDDHREIAIRDSVAAEVADIEIGPISRHIGGNDDLISVRSHVTDEGRPDRAGGYDEDAE